jgi:hypothetical protein
MKNLLARSVGAVTLFTSGVSIAQNGTMMNGDMWGGGWMGGYGGGWVPTLLLIVVGAAVAWFILQKRG